MSSLDLVVLAILAGSTLLGLMRGFVKEVFSLGAWILAFIGARFLGPQVAHFMPADGNPALQYGMALVFVFFVILIGAGLAGSLLAGLVKWAGLGSFDRFLGVSFGLLRGVAAVIGLTLLVGMTAFPKSQMWQTALSRPPLEAMAKKVVPWLPRDISVLIKYS